MDIQQFIRDLLESGEATAEEASRRRSERLGEPLPYPAQLLKGMTIDPAIAAGKMAGGEVPYYLEEDLARTVYPGFMGGEPELEVFPAGSLNPAMPEGAADIAMNAPTSGLIGGMARGTVDRNLLGVNAPVDPQADQYEQMIEEMNKAFDEMYGPNDPLYAPLEPTPNPPQAPAAAWTEPNYSDPGNIIYHQGAPAPAPAAAPHPLLSGIPKVQAAAAAPMPAPPLPMAKETGDKQKLAQYLMSDAFVSPSGLTGKDVVANPYPGGYLY